jgi:hypothetical protein
VNRWRQRLTELHAPVPAQAGAVQNVRNVQNKPTVPIFEHFEQIEQPVPPKETATAANQALAVWGEAEAERAAIVEHDGNVPRTWAEGFARLHPDRPPADVPLKRWQQFVDDVGHFLDYWADYAAALDWGPHELFGCDRDRPFARIDRSGLLWLLAGDRLIALSENTATIETRSGARQTWRRKPSEPGRVLAWDLPMVHTPLEPA